jgi:hypothetical protein
MKIFFKFLRGILADFVPKISVARKFENIFFWNSRPFGSVWENFLLSSNLHYFRANVFKKERLGDFRKKCICVEDFCENEIS